MRVLLDADVIVVGAGPIGLMLAGELCLAGERPQIGADDPDYQRV